MLRVARVALEEGASALAVATVEEGTALRAAEPRAEIVLYGHPTASELGDIVEADLSPFVAEEGLVAGLATEVARRRQARTRRAPLSVHLKVDTGMGRIGCRPEDAPSLARSIAQRQELHLRGVATHFPVSDGGEAEYTAQQTSRIIEVAEAIRREGITFDLLHAANSGAILDHPESWFDMVRPGIILYGYYPSDLQTRSIDIRPVLSIESELSFVKRVPQGTAISYGLTYRTPKETVIGTVPVGYADGYFRLLSNKSEVLLFEKAAGREGAPPSRRVPVVGTVCMDQFMVDLGPESHAVVGDRVTLFGADPRGPSAESLASLVGTIPYEILTRVSPRLPRVYVDG